MLTLNAHLYMVRYAVLQNIWMFCWFLSLCTILRAAALRRSINSDRW